MTDQIIRIKSSRQGYRRGGLVLDRDWREIDTADLTDAQKRAVLADPVLSIEGREDDGSWTPLPAAVRDGLASLFRGSTEADAGGVQPEVGTVVDDAELEQLKVDAEVGRAFNASVTANAEKLFALGFSPDRTETSLLLGSLVAVVEQRGEDSRRIADQAELGADLSSAIADSEELLTSLGLWPVEEPARFFLKLIDKLVQLEGITSLAAAIEPHEATLDDLRIPLTKPEEIIPRLMAALIEARAKLAEQAKDAPKLKRAATPQPPAKSGDDASKSS